MLALGRGPSSGLCQATHERSLSNAAGHLAVPSRSRLASQRPSTQERRVPDLWRRLCRLRCSVLPQVRLALADTGLLATFELYDNSAQSRVSPAILFRLSTWRNYVVLERAHERFVFARRVQALSSQIADLIPPNARVLDVGCGDGTISKLLLGRRPDISLLGIDVLVRPNTKIDVREFDGRTMPFEDDSFDCVIFVDVLHHTDDPVALLAESRRVSTGSLIIKDHRSESRLQNRLLRFMDWVGNSTRGVALPYNYLSTESWLNLIYQTRWSVRSWLTPSGIYPPIADFVFGRRLHVLMELTADKAGPG